MTGYDVIGDVHGCVAELRALLVRLGFSPAAPAAPNPAASTTSTNPPARRLVFVGDFTDRGPDSVGALQLIMGLTESGAALAVRGNHDEKLLAALRGETVKMSGGLPETLDAIAAEEAARPGFTARVREWLAALPYQLSLDGGRLVVAHAGVSEALQGLDTPESRKFCLFGAVTGERNQLGVPLREPWEEGYAGEAYVVYGHIPGAEVYRAGRTYGIDTGCVYGGHLTALRYPEMDTVSVPAGAVYAQPKRPLTQR